MSVTEAPGSPPGRAPLRRPRPEPEARQVVRRDVEGKELGRVDLDPRLFGIEPNRAVLHQVVTAQLAAARRGTQSTRTRAEVRGGGAKPYRQKGTGRARQGSIRSPHFAGGGVALGPKPRSYRQRTPKKMTRLALCSALSDRAAESRVALVDTWGFDGPRTKAARTALEHLGLRGRVLVVLTRADPVAERSFANLPQADTTSVGELCAYDVVRSDWVVFTDESLGELQAPGRRQAPELVVVEDEDAGRVVGNEELVESEAGEVVAELEEAEIEPDQAAAGAGEEA